MLSAACGMAWHGMAWNDGRNVDSSASFSDARAIRLLGACLFFSQSYSAAVGDINERPSQLMVGRASIVVE